jgi:hypothetical protein
MINITNRTKLYAGTFILILATLFIVLQLYFLSGSQLPGGNYDRYLDKIWADQITTTGYITANPFPNYPSLLSNANAYGFNIIPALITAILGDVSGLGSTEVRLIPITGFIFMASVVLLAHALYRGRYVDTILALLLSTFFIYMNLGMAGNLNRIGLSYSIFFFFLYSFIKMSKSESVAFLFMGNLFLLFYIFIYSSNAISIIPFILVLSIFKNPNRMRRKKMLLLTIYVLISFLYYLIIVVFLQGGINQVFGIIESRGFSFKWPFSSPGIWPGGSVYSPHYSWIDWFFLVYPFLILGVFLLFSIASRIRIWKRINSFTIYDQILIAFIVFYAVSILFNSLAGFATAGFDYIALFGWFVPILAVYGLDILFVWQPINEDHEFNSQLDSRIEKRKIVLRVRSLRDTRLVNKVASIFIVIFLIGLGVIGIFHYGELEPRAGEQVSSNEIQSSIWLEGKGVKVTSDLHFLSTYVAIAGSNASHFIPWDADMIQQEYYKVNFTFMREYGIDTFILTAGMEKYYIANFVGTRTLPNPDLDRLLSANSSCNYDNGEVRMYLISQ